MIFRVGAIMRRNGPFGFIRSETAMKDASAAKTRSVYLDLLRIIACLMVIFNHTNERGFYRFPADDLGSASFFLDMTMSIICKAGVPLFFMISGALLIDKEESWKSTFRRMIRIGIDLFVFSLLYFWIDSLLLGTPFSLPDTLSAMVGSNYWHLWYLYAYLVFLLALPVLRKLASGLDRKTSVYLLILAGAFMAFFPVLSEFLPTGLNENLNIPWIVSNIFTYPMAGYILVKKILEETFTGKRIGLLWLLNLCCFILGEVIEYQFLLRTPEQLGDMSGRYFDERFLINFCLVNAVTLFVTIRFLMKRAKLPGLLQRLIQEAGKDTFGIYLLHIWFLWKIPFLYGIWMRIEHTGVFGYHFGVLISCLLTFVLAGLLTAVLRRIPLIKKLF